MIFSIADVEKCLPINGPATNATTTVASIETAKKNQFEYGIVNDVVHHTLMFFYVIVNFILLVVAILENFSLKNVVAREKSEKIKSQIRRDAKAPEKELPDQYPYLRPSARSSPLKSSALVVSPGLVPSPGPNKCPYPSPGSYNGPDLQVNSSPHQSPFSDPVEILEKKQVPFVDDNGFVNYHSPVCDAIDYEASIKEIGKSARGNRFYKLQ